MNIEEVKVEEFKIEEGKIEELLIKEVKIDKRTVEKFLGYGSRKVPKNIEKVIDEEIEGINDLLEISVFTKEIHKDNNDFGGEYVKKCFAQCEKSYVALYSIGSKIEDKINKSMSSNDMIRGFVLDKVGIVALDYINDCIKKNLEDKYDLYISSEIYPGNKDFEVNNQRIIYEYLKNDDITINEYNQMHPIKSVAMILCIGKNKSCVSRCDECGNKCM